MKAFYYLPKGILILICSIFLSLNLYAQGDTWTWMSGSNTINQTGVYGTKGVSDVNNHPGGRDISASWQGDDGNLYFFGEFYNGFINDLWRYETSSGIWTWISGSSTINGYGVYGTKGVSNASNIPGGRENAMFWKGDNGDLFLFGGHGFPASGGYDMLNDLWRYNIYSGEWTWLSGSDIINQQGVYGTLNIPSTNNYPGARHTGVTWVGPSGDLYLFGGFGKAASGTGILNDLWKYDLSTGEWTWLSGSNSINDAGSYGTIGVENSSNVPAGRQRAFSANLEDGNFYLFGGFYRNYSNNFHNYYNDLWKYNLSTGNWTWLSGSSGSNTSGIYGIKGIADILNCPGSRNEGFSWSDKSGSIYLFGGEGYDSNGSFNVLNDLWEYNVSTGLWKWVTGSKFVNQNGVYGTQGIAHTNNYPGARKSGAACMGPDNNLYLFGGTGYSASSNGKLNDLWKYRFSNVSVCGDISSPTFWDADIIEINCDITIEDDVTLTIKPGATVKFMDHYQLIVEGTLIANGTDSNPITFTANNTTTGWDGIFIDSISPNMVNNDASIFEFCIFEYGNASGGSSPANQGGAFNIRNYDKVEITNCEFHDNTATNGGAIYTLSSGVKIKNSKFYNNTASASGGAIFLRSSATTLTGNVIYNNTASSSGGGIYTAYPGGNPSLVNNTIVNNSASNGGGFYSTGTSLSSITNTILYGNTATPACPPSIHEYEIIELPLV